MAYKFTADKFRKMQINLIYNYNCINHLETENICNLDQYRKIFPKRIFIKKVNDGIEISGFLKSIDHSIISIDQIEFM